MTYNLSTKLGKSVWFLRHQCLLVMIAQFISPCMMTLTHHTAPTSVTRQYMSSGDCLEDKREDYQNCSVLY